MKSHKETVTGKQTVITSLPVFANPLQNDNLLLFNVSSNGQVTVNSSMSQATLSLTPNIFQKGITPCSSQGRVIRFSPQ